MQRRARGRRAACCASAGGRPCCAPTTRSRPARHFSAWARRRHAAPARRHRGAGGAGRGRDRRRAPRGRGRRRRRRSAPSRSTHWLETRNKVPSWDFFLDREMLADTIEVAATWDRIAALYETVVAALAGVARRRRSRAGTARTATRRGRTSTSRSSLKPADFARAEAGLPRGVGRRAARDARRAAGRSPITTASGGCARRGSRRSWGAPTRCCGT